MQVLRVTHGEGYFKQQRGHLGPAPSVHLAALDKPCCPPQGAILPQQALAGHLFVKPCHLQCCRLSALQT